MGVGDEARTERQEGRVGAARGVAAAAAAAVTRQPMQQPDSPLPPPHATPTPAPQRPHAQRPPTLMVRSSEAEAKVLVSLGLNTSCGR